MVSGVEFLSMGGTSGQLWTLLAVVAGVGVLALLHYLASGLRNATYVHDMRVQVAKLRRDRLARMRESSGHVVTEVGEADQGKRAA